MKLRTLVVFGLILIGTKGVAASEIEVKISSLSNAANSTALEACGTATHKKGIVPLIVSVKHGDALYSTITGQSGRWCVLFKRWNYRGIVDVSATTLDGSGSSDFLAMSLPQETSSVEP